ncbi:hypothetical protein JMM81_20210 [Bacillus sp. V3B]|uniref:hypothetical protein n=1 Tax=Bacillus sp. V3B TaxID=2804915 RepID=UPI00210EBA32|nr:hypothetical protein [Bacillus sp. V3B]MCQ6277201.1 hypothetical protein [Bacillus sp. V3B]
MKKIQTKIGTHQIQMSIDSKSFIDFIQRSYQLIEVDQLNPDMYLTIKQGYGVPFVDYHVDITKEAGKIFYHRADYLIEADTDYRNATIFAHDDFALKHAMTNLYSAFIVYHNWGLLIHSSCVIEEERAHIFAGQSGAGKSTAARLSEPRPLLSDEATLIQITSKAIIVHDSPFRSELMSSEKKACVPLASIQLLHHSPQNNRMKIRKPDALIQLMDKVFYWGYSPEETKTILHLLRTLVDEVPTYELYFKKDDTFWELIS